MNYYQNTDLGRETLTISRNPVAKTVQYSLTRHLPSQLRQGLHFGDSVGR